MAYREINARVKIRRDTAINFTTKNPILLAGELAIEQDTNKVKVGNGSDPWIKLPYLIDMDSVKQLVEEFEKSMEKLSVPIGSIIYIPGSSIPSFYSNNWRICNGANVAKSVYPDLFNYMGWSGSTHALPNLVDNRFIEGSTSTCQYKNAGLPNIKGGFNLPNASLKDSRVMQPYGCFKIGDRQDYGTGYKWGTSDYHCGITLTFDASRSGVEHGVRNTTEWNTIYNDSVNTVQLKSMTLLPIIRVK